MYSEQEAILLADVIFSVLTKYKEYKKTAKISLVRL